MQTNTGMWFHLCSSCMSKELSPVNGNWKRPTCSDGVIIASAFVWSYSKCTGSCLPYMCYRPMALRAQYTYMVVALWGLSASYNSSDSDFLAPTCQNQLTPYSVLCYTRTPHTEPIWSWQCGVNPNSHLCKSDRDLAVWTLSTSLGVQDVVATISYQIKD